MAYVVAALLALAAQSSGPGERVYDVHMHAPLPKYEQKRDILHDNAMQFFAAPTAEKR